MKPFTGTTTAALDAGSSQRLRASFRTLRVTYFGMLSSLLVYWVVVMLTRKVGAIPAGRGTYAETDWLRYPLYVVGAGLAVLVVVLRRRLLEPAMVRDRATGGDAQAWLNAIFTVYVIAFAVAEIPAILGLALYFVGGYLTDFWVMSALTLFAFAAAWPREGQGAEILQTLLAAPAGRAPTVRSP